ncbi:MAG: sulfite exporter TauE/SafE family protein [Acidobacteria bacterium]|nr:sulfite exporter TauE/SafE family protein [Acidobacteriota bacterium]
MSPEIIAVIVCAGAVAGCLGGLLGIGGGVFLVPFLHLVIGLPLNVARGIGLVTVIGTSSVVAADATSRPLVNLRLGMLLQVPASAGALAAAIVVARLPDRVLYVLFALVTFVIAVIMLTRLEKRNVLFDDAAAPGSFGGRYFEAESGREIVYQTHRLPLAAVVSLVAGYVSGTLGIGGGIMQVPAINAWCGVPLRAAAATSAVVIGITAAASAPIYYARGDVLLPAAAAAVLGVLIGSRFGLWFGGRAKARWLKMLMALILAAVSVSFLVRAL